MSEMQVPLWAARARQVFRTLIVLYALFWLVRAALALIDLAFDTDVYTNDASTWVKVTLLSVLAAGAISGLVWLAGAAVAGYREPEN